MYMYLDGLYIRFSILGPNLAHSNTFLVPIHAVSALSGQFFVGNGEGPQGTLEQLLVQPGSHLVPVLSQVVQQDTEEQ